MSPEKQEQEKIEDIIIDHEEKFFEDQDIKVMFSKTTGKIASALAKAQLKIIGAKKDSENPFYKSSYADLSAVWDACHIFLNENEIAITQIPFSDESGKKFLLTSLIHSSGEFIRGKLEISTKGMGAQEVGSGISYARRYMLSAMTGVAQKDDDGEAAEGRKESERKQQLSDLKKMANKLSSPEDVKKLSENMKASGSYSDEEIKYVTGKLST